MKSEHVKAIAILASSIIALVALILSAFFLNRCFNAPEATVRGFERFISAINQKTIKTEYASTATKIEGTARLQVATISQVEIFSHEDRPKYWPDIVVTATAPVEYTYFLDLNGKWEFDMEGAVTPTTPGGIPSQITGPLIVTAPLIEFNTPAVDVSKIKETVVGSFRLEATHRDALRKAITDEVKKRAQTNILIARESARRQTENFVRTWLSRQYGVTESVAIIVRFQDEATRPAKPARF